MSTTQAEQGTELEHKRNDGWSIDDRCLNCNIARQLAPGMIAYKEGGEYDGLSTVIRQPETEADVQKMYLAAHACPTRSIHPPADRWDADSDPYPKALDEEGVVLLCGHASPQTYGATSYLVRRPDGTAMMIDTPR
ncbi:4Fe-4S domain-containing protein [Streptomyces melanosporofaciens]